MTESEIAQWNAEYSLQYPLYNAISTAVEDYEGSRGGLRAPEVWREVLLLEERIPTAPRRDKYISLERTRLKKEFRRFQVQVNKKLYWETKEDRPDKDVERSVVCVLLAFGMRLASYPSDMENPYEPIMERIRQMAMQCEDLDMVWAITNAYYDGEDEEEALGNFVPEEDVLQPHLKPKLPKNLQEIHDRMQRVFDYFRTALECEEVVSELWGNEGFDHIWLDLLRMESILRALVKPTGIKNTLKDDDIKEGDEDYIVKSNDYNLLLVLNNIGVMREQGAVTSNISDTRKLFFEEQSKDKYFNPVYFHRFGTSDSAFATEDMYNDIVKIITKNKIKS